MKKTDVNLKILVAMVALFGITLSLMAQPQPGQRQFQNRERVAPALLDLTEEQKDEIKAIHIEQLKAVQPLKDELRINKAKINALMNKDNPDMKEIVPLVEANGKLITQIQIENIESQIKIRSLLTEEQKTLFDAHGKRMQRERAMAENRPHRRFPGRSRF